MIFTKGRGISTLKAISSGNDAINSQMWTLYTKYKESEVERPPPPPPPFFNLINYVLLPTSK
jgi:hypothetical protein